MSDPKVLRTELKALKIKFAQGEATYADLSSAAQAYIRAVKSHCKAKGLRPPKMTVPGIIRTL